MERLWLQATACELALHPITPITFFGLLEGAGATVFTASERTTLQTLETRFEQLFPRDAAAMRILLFRLFPASVPNVRSLRLALDQVLSYGAPES